MRMFCRSFTLLFILLLPFAISGFSFRGVRAADGNPVHNINTGIDYSTIQSAIDASETLNGHTINIDLGTYVENVVVSKSISLVGTERNSTIVDGNRNMAAVIRVAANNVVIKGLTVRNGTTGILVDQVNDTLIFENNAIDNVDLGEGYREIEHGILVRYSGNCTLRDNVVANNSNSGVLFTNSWNFTAHGNFVYDNRLGYGLNANASSNGVFRDNHVLSSNFDGIGLGTNSTDCLVVGNTVRNSSFLGIWVDSGSLNNIVYHNNFFFNRTQAPTTGTIVQWDNGLEGNYWIDYAGSDFNNDGIGDAPAVINPDNSDNYPLMGTFSTFIPYKRYSVNVISNSTITEMAFFETNSTIRMRVSNMTATQTNEFARVQVPHALMVQPYNVTIDSGQPSYSNHSVYDDGTSRWLYFSYGQSTREVIIQGTASGDVDPPIINLVSPENRLYQTESIELNFTTDEETPWIGYSLDGRANVTIQGNITLTGLSAMVHNITVFANDTAGNMGTSGIVFFTVSQQQLSIWIILGGISIIVAIIIIIVAFYFRRRRKAIAKS